MEYLINISFDGSKFYGFQRQKDKYTVEGELERTLSIILNKKTKVIGCSRTDRGVHALDFYAGFSTNKKIDINKTIYSLNSLIDKSIFIKDIKKVSDDFSARHSVKQKEYMYKINTSVYNPLEKDYVYQYNRKINISLLKSIAKVITGKHNFKSFTSDKDKYDYIRTIDKIKIVEKDNYVCVHIYARGFLRYMVRNIIGLMLEINENKKSINDIEKIFKSENREKNGICAPGNGLYLVKIRY